MSATQGIVNEREITAGIEWLIRRPIEGKKKEFPAPSFAMQMEMVRSIAERLSEIEVPEPLMQRWASACKVLADVAYETLVLAEWFAARQGSPR